MKSILAFVLISLSFFSLNSFGQDSTNCKGFFSDGTTLTYFDDGVMQANIVIAGDIWTEKFLHEKVTIVSTCEWISDCTFKLTIVKTKGKTGLRPGQSITMVVSKIDGSKAYYNYEGSKSEVKRYYMKLN